ncbi:SRPBCC family protein [Bacteriovorax sp. PP10]|uniref:SRPBCC family protein n=1 Tax=Bacteriovorax antarcticus TaxID=3088717 RepID=A0ABU5VWC6_9BACT|nr:SRPBCC family protein [Bacteriovorax sp. PP10]MEA9357351.1 SRPBCC family protein [Bacteriovorax sp. PP10]
MKIKLTLIVAGLLIIVIAILGVIAPTHFVIEKSVSIEKPRFVVFDKIRFSKSHEAWNPWFKKDRLVKYDWKGQDGTVGFITHWVGNNKVGEGEQEIKKIVEGERIDYEMRFEKPMKTTNLSSLITTEEGDTKTKLTWVMRGKMSFPGNVMYMVFKMQPKLEDDFEEGLNVLKAILEKDVN